MNKKLVAFIASAILLTTPLVMLAANAGQPINPGTWFQEIIGRLLSIVILPIFSGAVVIMLLYAGFLFVTAHGDPAKVQTAKKALIWAAIGIAVGLLSYSLVTFIGGILGVPTPPPPQ